MTTELLPEWMQPGRFPAGLKFRRNERGGCFCPVRFSSPVPQIMDGTDYFNMRPVTLADWLDPTPRMKVGRAARRVPRRIFKLGKPAPAGGA